MLLQKSRKEDLVMSKRVIITFPVSPEFRDKINTYCEVNKDKELSRAALCRIALREYMERNPIEANKK